MLFCLFTSGPDGAPHGITGHAVNESAIMIYWEELSCALMNGDIISYSVSYTRDGDGDEKGLLVSVTERRLTFTDLEPLSRYTISVAAVNRNGTGPSSSPVTIATTTGTAPVVTFMLYILHSFTIPQEHSTVWSVLA